MNADHKVSFSGLPVSWSAVTSFADSSLDDTFISTWQRKNSGMQFTTAITIACLPANAPVKLTKTSFGKWGDRGNLEGMRIGWWGSGPILIPPPLCLHTISSSYGSNSGMLSDGHQNICWSHDQSYLLVDKIIPHSKPNFWNYTS